MKKIMIVILTIGISLSLFAKQYPLKVDQAYLYLNGGELIQSVEISVIKGTHDYLLTNVAVGVNDKTIRLSSSTDHIKVLGFYYIRNFDYSEDLAHQIDLYKDSIESFVILKRDSELKIKLINEEISLLKSGVNNLMASDKVNYSTTQLNQLLKYYHIENEKKYGDLFANTKSLERYKLKLEDLNEKLKKISSQYNKSGALKVKINASKTSKIALSLKSFTPYIAWEPKYEANVSTIHESLALDFKAQITQESKLDWNQVKIKLYSNRISFNTQLQELQSYWVDYEKNSHAVRAKAYDASMLEVVEVSVNEPDVIEKQTGIEYVLPDRYSIFSSSSYSDLLPIASYSLPIQLEMKSVPIYDSSVYMQAKLLDSKGLQLLSGPMNVTCDGVYLGTTHFLVGTENRNVELTLGKNNHVFISRTMVNQSNRETTFGGKKVRKEAYETILKNTSSIKQVVYVKDRYPLAVDESIEVELLDSTNQPFSIDKEKGFVTWKIELEPYSTQSLFFEYQLKYSKDKKLSL